MLAAEIAKYTDAKIHFDNGLDAAGFYCGDFLSRVMSKAPAGCCWLTVISNVNVAGVCVMADIAAVLLCEGVQPDPALSERCKAENISLMSTSLPVFECSKRLSAQC